MIFNSFILYLCLFRANELGHLSYSKVDFTNGLSFNWIMTKVAREKYITFSNAYDDPCLDVFLIFALFFMSGGGRQHITDFSGDRDWVIPLLAYSSNSSTKINQMLDALASLDSTYSSETPKITSHALRRSAINILHENSVMTFSHIVARTGHDNLEAVAGTIANYLEIGHTLQAQAGNALCGWPNPLRKVTNATLDPVWKFISSSTNPEKEKRRLTNFILDLLHIDHPHMQPSRPDTASLSKELPPGRLWAFVECLFASFLMYLPSVMKLLPKEHNLLLHFENTARVYQQKASDDSVPYIRSTWLQWGEYIKQQFLSDNVQASSTDADIKAKLDITIRENQVMKEKISKMTSEIQQLHEVIWIHLH